MGIKCHQTPVGWDLDSSGEDRQIIGDFSTEGLKLGFIPSMYKTARYLFMFMKYVSQSDMLLNSITDHKSEDRTSLISWLRHCPLCRWLLSISTHFQLEGLSLKSNFPCLSWSVLGSGTHIEFLPSDWEPVPDFLLLWFYLLNITVALKPHLS